MIRERVTEARFAKSLERRARGTFTQVSVSWWFVGLAGCAHDLSAMATLGPTFGTEHQGIVLAFEVAPVLHPPFPAPAAPIAAADGTVVPPLYDPHDGPSSSFGFAPSVAVGTDWHTGLGFSAFTAVGADVLPWLFEHGTAVGLGGQVAYSRGGRDGFYVVAPRLWFAVPVGGLVSVGLMLRGQFGFGTGTDGVGPAIVLRR
jgi:hypothetical protein